METKQRFVGIYMDLTTKERINFLLEHLSHFESYHQAYQESIEERISCIRCYERKKKGSLGVRVMSGNTISDITAQKAMEHLEIRESMNRGTVSSKMIRNKEEREEIVEAIYEWKLMRSEYEILLRQLQMLKPSDYEILYPYLMREKTKRQIAEELSIEKSSVEKRIFRIRKKFVDHVIPYFKEYKS